MPRSSGPKHLAHNEPVTVIRVATGALGAVHAWWGIWALLFPLQFFETFPGFGRRWTAAYPPYNEHLVTDLGATFLTLGFLLGVGAAIRNGAVRTVALAAVAFFSTLHLAFHAGHWGSLGTADLATSLVALVLGVLAPLALLIADRRIHRTESPV
jgi:hypothetical protein